MRPIILAALVLASILGGKTAVYGESQPPTQRQWMTALVEGLGWSFGLPEEPKANDFLRILEGSRLLRIEAEEHKQPEDVVSVKEYDVFGPFSGGGWVSGISSPTTTHLRFMIPLSGTYKATAALRLPGHEITIGDRRIRADGGQGFTEVDLGEVELVAGMTEVAIDLPPNGSVDYLELFAPPRPAVRPLGGWHPDSPLTVDDMAVTAVRALSLEGLLPPSGERTVFEAEDHAELEGARVTDISYLGSPSGGKWVRAGIARGKILLTFPLPDAGAYSLLLRGEGQSTLEFLLNDRLRIEQEFPTFLKTLPLGSFYLPAGPNTLDIRVGPRDGVDALILQHRDSDPAAYRRLAGFAGETSPPSAEQMDSLLSLLAAIGLPR